MGQVKITLGLNKILTTNNSHDFYFTTACPFAIKDSDQTNSCLVRFSCVSYCQLSEESLYDYELVIFLHRSVQLQATIVDTNIFRVVSFANNIYSFLYIPL